jgi:hypothetical protein
MLTHCVTTGLKKIVCVESLRSLVFIKVLLVHVYCCFPKNPFLTTTAPQNCNETALAVIFDHIQ